MGFEKHRIAADTTSTSDLCVFGIRYLLDERLIDKDDIGAVVVVTITPDHFVPHVGNIIQGKLGFGRDVLFIDIAQGCAGFILGLLEAYLLLDAMPDKKILVVNADVLSHRVSKQDRGSYPLVGDAAAITVVECDESTFAYVGIEMDGSRRDALIIPAGGSRLPSSPKTLEKVDAGDGNIRSLEDLRMDGQAVFRFVQEDAPVQIESILEFAGVSKEAIDWFFFHQPNEFMLQKLAEKLGVSSDKVPMNIVRNLGNPSGASIPVDMTYNAADDLLSNKRKCCLSAFGGGLCCGTIVTDVGNLEFCKYIESDL